MLLGSLGWGLKKFLRRQAVEDGDEEEMDALLLAEDEDSDAEIIRKGPEKPVKENFPHLCP